MTDLQVSSFPVEESGGERRAGEILRQTRESMGMSVSEVAFSLKLNARQIEAIEGGRFEQLPGSAFTRGFLRNYARLLKLDPAPLLAEIEPPASDATVELAPASNAHGKMPEVGKGRFSRSVLPGVMAALGLLGVVVAGWYYDNQKRQPVEALVASLPEARVASEEAAGQSVAAVPPQGESPVPPPIAAVPTPVGEQAAVSPAVPVPPAPAPVVVPVEAVPVVPPVEAAAKSAGQERLVFDFSQDAWVEIKDGAGKVVFSKLGKEGTREQVDVRAPMSLVIGNARSVKLERNGAPVALGLSPKGTVARLKLE